MIYRYNDFFCKSFGIVKVYNHFGTNLYQAEVRTATDNIHIPFLLK